MKKYRVIYTTFVELNSVDEDDALDLVKDWDKNEFAVFDVEVEEVNTNEN